MRLGRSGTVTLDGEIVAAMYGLGYRLVYICQAVCPGNQSDETGFSLGVMYEMELGNGLSVAPLIEYVHFDNAEGVSGKDPNFLTLAGRLEVNN
mgnify:CR=1 FL=1